MGDPNASDEAVREAVREALGAELRAIVHEAVREALGRDLLGSLHELSTNLRVLLAAMASFNEALGQATAHASFYDAIAARAAEDAHENEGSPWGMYPLRAIGLVYYCRPLPGDGPDGRRRAAMLELLEERLLDEVVHVVGRGQAGDERGHTIAFVLGGGLEEDEDIEEVVRERGREAFAAATAPGMEN